MPSPLLSFLDAFVPRASPISLRERVRSPVGALLGILLTGLVSNAAVKGGTALPILIAPMGASAVLLFAVPASPLAQPWSIVGGNVVSALIGVSAALAIANPVLAAAVAIGVAIAVMMALRCLHPPSGAVALTAVLGGPAIRTLGYGFVLWPVGANSLILLAVALLFNNAVGRSYPHRPHGTPGPRKEAAPDRTGVSAEDLEAALVDYGELLEVDRGDLEVILRDAELRSYRRRSGRATCAAIMTRNVVAVGPASSIRDAHDQLRAHHIKALPVTDDSARVIGIVTQTDLLEKAAWGRSAPRLSFRHRLRLTLSRRQAPSGSVGDIMTTAVRTVTPEMVLADVARVMARTGLHHLPVVGSDKRLLGMVAEFDLIVSLLAEIDETRSVAGEYGRPASD